MKIDLTAEIARALVAYNRDTGELTWLPRGPEWFEGDHQRKSDAALAFNGQWAGKEACGALHSAGYKHGLIVGNRMFAHRLIWLVVFGSEPQGQIDHINGDRTDNRLANLRLVSGAENSRNLALRDANTSGVMGVHFHVGANRWRSQITVERKRVHLGYFDTIEEAAEARKRAEREFGFHPNHGRAKPVDRREEAA